jgi:hypothetical protein
MGLRAGFRSSTSRTTGTSKTPVTFGDPTGLAINAAMKDGAK